MPETAPAKLPLLAELPESQASGAIRHVYAGIKQLSGVPMVALIYRHLATIPGALQWSWALLEPVMRAGLLQRRAWELAATAVVVRQPSIPRPALRACGLGGADERAIAGVLDAYNRANPVNIMAVRCLALHLAGEVAPLAAADPLPLWAPPPQPPALPPMIDPPAMAPAVRELAQLLTQRSAHGPPSTLWPSLYRHLAHWPAFLGLAGVLVPPEFGAIDEVANRLRRQIDDSSAELARRMAPPADMASPRPEARRQLQAAIEQFSARIPEMVVIGTLLRRALPHDAQLPKEASSEP